MFLLVYHHTEYQNCHSVPWMQAWRRLRHLSMPSSITPCYTPTYASNRFCLRSFISCVFVVDYLPQIL